MLKKFTELFRKIDLREAVIAGVIAVLGVTVSGGVLAAAGTFTPIPSTGSAVQQVMQAQGRIVDSLGNPVNGTYNTTYTLFLDGGATQVAGWTETISTTFSNGNYSVELGNVSSLGSITWDKQYWLKMSVPGIGDFVNPYRAVPYAMNCNAVNGIQWRVNAGAPEYNDGSGWKAAGGSANNMFCGAPVSNTAVRASVVSSANTYYLTANPSTTTNSKLFARYGFFDGTAGRSVDFNCVSDATISSSTACSQIISCAGNGSCIGTNFITTQNVTRTTSTLKWGFGGGQNSANTSVSWVAQQSDGSYVMLLTTTTNDASDTSCKRIVYTTYEDYMTSSDGLNWALSSSYITTATNNYSTCYWYIGSTATASTSTSGARYSLNTASCTNIAGEAGCSSTAASPAVVGGYQWSYSNGYKQAYKAC